MSDYLGDLLSRSFEADETVHPRLPFVFEPSPYSGAETVPSPERPPAGPAVPAVNQPTSGELAWPRPRALETATLKTDAASVATPVDPGSPGNVGPLPVLRPEQLETIVADPAFREANGSPMKLPLKEPIDRADPTPTTRKLQLGMRGDPPRHRGLRGGKTRSLERLDRPPVPGQRAPSGGLPPRISQTGSSERLVRTGRGTDSQPEATDADLAVEEGRSLPDAPIRAVVQSDMRSHSGVLPQDFEVEPTVAPEVLPAATPPIDRRENSSPVDAPKIEVHIGRIEVRAAAPKPPEPPREPPRPRRPALSLDDYLNRRKEGFR